MTIQIRVILSLACAVLAVHYMSVSGNLNGRTFSLALTNLSTNVLGLQKMQVSERSERCERSERYERSERCERSVRSERCHCHAVLLTKVYIIIFLKVHWGLSPIGSGLRSRVTFHTIHTRLVSDLHITLHIMLMCVCVCV